MPETDDRPAPARSAEAQVLIAIDRLQQAIENSRAEIAAQGALQASRLTSVIDMISRLDATVKTLVHEVQMLKRDHVELVERVSKLEAFHFREGIDITKRTARGRRTVPSKRR